ncbi:MAG TPA: agmatine deiminase [Anaerolineaceae bacterium]|nr:agmatine deiminase [Anaerolineaceae bacterium]
MSALIRSTPRVDGFHMPGEFEPHSGIWMLWPERPDNWRAGAAPAQRAFAQVAAALARFEPVSMGVSQAQYLNARALLPAAVRVVELSSNDSWMRDCGPTLVSSEKSIRAVDWGFNAWGGLYTDYSEDELVAMKVAEIERVDRYKAPLIMEGGSIHTDGQGTLLTTRECLLNLNRNPQLTQAEIEGYLRDYLGVEKIIWLARGMYLDETNGHVDNICTFLRPGEVALAWTEDRSDPQYEISRENEEILLAAADARGRSLKVHRIPLPSPVYITREESEGVLPVDGTLPRKEGDRLAASYVNFAFCNGGAVVPTFNDPMDDVTLDLLRRLLPERQVVGVPSREILLGGGNVHCITQQVPEIKV